jgi:plastocyanin
LLGLVLLASATTARAGDLEGRLVVDVPGLDLQTVAPVVVYLEPLEESANPRTRSAATMRQHNARFAPPFLVVPVGQSVSMPNEDAIFHNAFSFSEPNHFDLGLYPAGESRSVRFDHPGVVRIYCSIHESMNATIFVAPTPWFAVGNREGRFRIQRVPAGRWRLRTWTESLPDTTRDLTLTVAGARSVLVHLAGKPGD